MSSAEEHSRELEEAYKAQHPEVDWTVNEVLWKWNGEGQPMTPGSYWSIQERDETYRQLVEMGIPVRWDAERQLWEMIKEPAAAPEEKS